MLDFFNKLGLILAYVRTTFNDIGEMRILMATLNEQLNEIAAKLDEASNEIVAKIAELEASVGTISVEHQAKLDSIKASAQALADIVPDEEPEDDEEGELIDPVPGE